MFDSILRKCSSKCRHNHVHLFTFYFSYSKALWVIISGTNTNASADVVSHELKRAHDQLQNGLNHFKDPSKEAEAAFKTQVSDSVFKFTVRLERCLVSCMARLGPRVSRDSSVPLNSARVIGADDGDQSGLWNSDL
jgi:hypothetical protein